MLFDEVIEVVVISTDKEKRVGEGMEEDLFKGLKNANADSGEELDSEPTVEHGVAGVSDFGIKRRVSAGEDFAEECEQKLLQREYVAC